MIRPMNELELNLGMPCDAISCSALATQCDSETTDYPLFLCSAHAVEHAILQGGMVRVDSAQRLAPNP